MGAELIFFAPKGRAPFRVLVIRVSLRRRRGLVVNLNRAGYPLWHIAKLARTTPARARSILNPARPSSLWGAAFKQQIEALLREAA